MRATPWILALATVLATGAASAKGTRHGKRHSESIKLPHTSVPAPDAPKAEEASAAPIHKGPTRIDFDDRLIQGQTNKAGAVYLYDRKELEVRSMVKMRESFRNEIYQDAYGAQ